MDLGGCEMMGDERIKGKARELCRQGHRQKYRRERRVFRS